MTSAPQGQFGVGVVLSQAMSVFGANLVPFCLLAFILMAPSFLYMMFFFGSDTDPLAGFSFGNMLATIIQMVMSQLIAAAITHGSFQYLRGRKVGLGEALSRGLALILPMLGVAILSGLAIGIGTILLVVPGIIVAVMLWVAIPAAVVERPGVIASLQRSAELTKGYRWPVFGILVIIVVVVLAVMLVLQFILLRSAAPGLFVFVSWIVESVFSAFSATAAAVGYYFLRVAKEGVDIDQIARVFD